MKILAINPGSTSTKIAVFEDRDCIFEKTLRHKVEKIDSFENIADQYDFRKGLILEALEEASIEIYELETVVGRGGLVKPIKGGTYLVDDALIEDLVHPKQGEHASNLGGILAKSIADAIDKKAYIVDPVVVDELEDIARISGVKEIERKSIFHALNQKAVAHKYAESVGKKIENLNLIIAHMGGGVSVGAHLKGNVVDVNNALNGEGPFSPERAGTLPAAQLVELCFSGKYEEKEVQKLIKGAGGFVSYLGTNDGIEVEKRVQAGDQKALLIQQAFIYQVAKEIGALAAALKGKVDAILLTGGLAYGKAITDGISEYVSFLAPIEIFPGEEEMSALAEGARRVLAGEEKEKIYG